MRQRLRVRLICQLIQTVEGQRRVAKTLGFNLETSYQLQVIYHEQKQKAKSCGEGHVKSLTYDDGKGFTLIGDKSQEYTGTLLTEEKSQIIWDQAKGDIGIGFAYYSCAKLDEHLIFHKAWTKMTSYYVLPIFPMLKSMVDTAECKWYQLILPSIAPRCSLDLHKHILSFLTDVRTPMWTRVRPAPMDLTLIPPHLFPQEKKLKGIEKDKDKSTTVYEEEPDSVRNWIGGLAEYVWNIFT